MSKRPNIKEIGLKIVRPGTARHADHPVHHLAANEGFLYLPTALVRPDPNQPRKHFDAVSLDELTASVKERGVLQPVLTRKDPSGEGYILIAGERRWRAATAAGLGEIPALVRNETTLELSQVERLNELARRIGVSRSTIGRDAIERELQRYEQSLPPQKVDPTPLEEEEQGAVQTAVARRP